MVQQVLTLNFSQSRFNLAIVLVDPVVQGQVQHEELVIHITGGYCKKQELMVESERGALLADEVVIDGQLRVLKCDLQD